MKQLLFILSCIAFMLVGCGKFSDGSSVWQKGDGFLPLWVAPLLTGIGAAIFWYMTYKSARSGSEKRDMDPKSPTFGKYFDTPGNKVSIGHLVLAIGFTLSTIGIIIWVNYDK